MARGAVLTGRTLADLVQTALTLVVLAVVAVLVGWRTHENFGKVLAGFGLLLLLGYAFSWIGALIGLSVRTPEAATSGGLIWLFPLTFISNAFVPSENMPAFLRTIANWNPFSATVQACRLQRHRAGLPSALRQPPGGLSGAGRLAHAAPGVGLVAVVRADCRAVPHARGTQVPPGRRLITVLRRTPRVALGSA
ncbi:transport permease protein [Streptomyces olivochromogenes]|uniref:Transport permease protein n=1 Tax=Streptomyces olivochromogenes TaxID=1963 RepID=A0A250VA64_STROL|nr:transport permease protein [Streptomyces olivochromogenes]